MIPLIFIIYLLIVAFLVGCVAPARYNDFSYLTHWISNLGRKGYRSYPIFFWAGNTFLFFVCLFFYYLFNTLPKTPLTFPLILSGVIMAAALSAVTYFPMDTKELEHLWLAGIIVSSAVIFNLVQIIMALWLSVFPGILVAANLLVLLFSVLTGFSQRRLDRKYGLLGVMDLKEIRSKEKSFINRNHTLWEWLMFSSQITSFIILSLTYK